MTNGGGSGLPEKTIGTLLSGGEGVGIGAQAVGLRHIWGIENQDDIARVARDNGFAVVTGDLLDADPAAFEPPLVLHVSPECKTSSIANQSMGETDLDLAVADKICAFIVTLRPRVFTLENVYQYRKLESFGRILNTLAEHGYFYTYSNVNAADYGVPQTRRRLILRARRGMLLPLLPPTQPWVSWHAAIEDLIDDLPDSTFAPWQLRHMPEDMKRTLLVHNNKSRDRHGHIYRVSSRAADRPAMTVTTKALGQWRVFLFDGQMAAFRNPTIRDSRQPAPTITAVGGRSIRVYANGRVVKFTARAMARLQTFPDWYRLPERVTIAGRIIGNAVPPTLYQKIIGGLLV